MLNFGLGCRIPLEGKVLSDLFPTSDISGYLPMSLFLLLLLILPLQTRLAINPNRPQSNKIQQGDVKKMR